MANAKESPLALRFLRRGIPDDDLIENNSPQKPPLPVPPTTGPDDGDSLG